MVTYSKLRKTICVNIVSLASLLAATVKHRIMHRKLLRQFYLQTGSKITEREQILFNTITKRCGFLTKDTKC